MQTTPLSQSELAALLEPTQAQRREAAVPWGTLLALQLTAGLTFVVMLSIALDAAGDAGDWLQALLFGGLFLCFLAPSLAILWDRILPPLVAETHGLARRRGLRHVQIPWSRLAPVVVTGDAWPYEVRLLDTEGLLIATCPTASDAERAVILEAATRLGARDARLASAPTPDATLT